MAGGFAAPPSCTPPFRYSRTAVTAAFCMTPATPSFLTREVSPRRFRRPQAPVWYGSVSRTSVSRGYGGCAFCHEARRIAVLCPAAVGAASRRAVSAKTGLSRCATVSLVWYTGVPVPVARSRRRAFVSAV